jgi:hypothetical protein
VESITKWWAESGDEVWRCALICCSAWSLSSMKVLTPQHVPSNCFDRHHAFVMRSPVMLSPAWDSTFIGAAFALPEKIMAAVSALSGEGSPRFRVSSFDSILIRPRSRCPT